MNHRALGTLLDAMLHGSTNVPAEDAGAPAGALYVAEMSSREKTGCYEKITQTKLKYLANHEGQRESWKHK